MSIQRTTIPGSEKKPLPKAKVIGKVDPNQRIEVTVVLRPRKSGSGSLTPNAATEHAMNLGTQLPEQRTYISREAFAAERNLTLVEASLSKRIIRLAGTVKDLTAAFRPNLKKSRVAGRIVRMR